jgi:hypothetical protein
MPRIPDEVIERLKSEVSLEKLAAARGVELKRHGADLLGRCPFHDDREPSLVISPKEESVALPRSVQRWRNRYRLGDARGGRQLPARGGAVD